MLRRMGSTLHCSLRLTVSSPALLLNHVAQRYSDTQRVVAEYVDNALDDAEALYDANKNAYARPVAIDLIVNRPKRTLTVIDNARGMDAAVLQRIVQNVGESQKRGQAFLNGKFGFGVHAFRAAATTLHVRTCNGEGHVLSMALDRSQDGDIDPPARTKGTLRTSNTGTGTEVTVSGFEDAWMDGLTAPRITHQIQHHFDRLLSRGQLRITVRDAGSPPIECRPFAFDTLPGTELVESFESGGETVAHLSIKVSSDAPIRGAGHVSVFSNGRRVNDVCELRTFMRSSVFKNYIWAHPHLVGYIEVSGDVAPVITRDDFQRTTARAALYKHLTTTIEPKLKLLIDAANSSAYAGAVGKVEDLLGQCLSASLKTQKQRVQRYRADWAAPSTGEAAPAPFSNRRIRAVEAELVEESEPDDENDAELVAINDGTSTASPQSVDPGGAGAHTPTPPSPPEKPKQLLGGLSIRFVETLHIDGMVGRAQMVGTALHINTTHPDFVARTRFNRTGQPTFGDRLVSYLAYVVGVTYCTHRSNQPGITDVAPISSTAYEDMIDVIANVELRLRKHFNAAKVSFPGGNKTTPSSVEGVSI